MTKQNQKMTPFKVMTSLLNNTTPTKEEQGTMNSFFLVRWLSNNPHTIIMGNNINVFYNMPVQVQYRFCSDWVNLTDMKKRVKFISFKKDPKANEMMQKLLDNIMRYYKVNSSTAEQYYEMMDNKTRDKMYSIYDEGLI